MDVISILDKLESMRMIRTHKQVGNYMQIYCPFHSDGKEKKASCGVLLQEEHRGGRRYPEGLFHCFTCKYAKPMDQAVTDLLKLHGVSKSGIDWLSENIPGFNTSSADYERMLSGDLMYGLMDKYAVEYVNSMLGKKQEFISEEELASYRYTVPYMYERKMTDEIIEKFDVGYDGNWIPPGRKKPTPCITFPVRDRDGNTLFFCRRSIQGKIYNYPTGVSKPLYGIDMIPKGWNSIIICESIINALTAISWGYVAVALMGTGNSLQIQQLRELGAKEFVLCLDGDEAGRKASEKLKRALMRNAIVWTVNIPDGKDVNDLTKEEFDILYLHRE